MKSYRSSNIMGKMARHFSFMLASTFSSGIAYSNPICQSRVSALVSRTSLEGLECLRKVYLASSEEAIGLAALSDA